MRLSQLVLFAFVLYALAMATYPDEVTHLIHRFLLTP